MRLIISTVVLLGVALISLTACSIPNNVQQSSDKESVVKLANDNGNKHRYTNLYRGKQQYPTTCSKDCYPPHPAVICTLPAEQCHYSGPQTPPQLKTGFSLQWLGHASFMLTSVDGKQLLLDPVLGQFDWPVNWVSRLVGIIQRPLTPTITAEQLAATDAVLYSHLHYDHFSHATIAQIGGNATYYMPLGMADYMPDAGYNIVEHGWYSQSQLGELTIHLVPAHHFNSRKLINDHNQALWGGWLIEHKGRKLLFAGDTGYSQHFNDIQQRFGDIDICLLPIASYHHETDGDWYRYVHTTPEDALTAAQELGCKVMIPWGYGNASWQMGDHSSHSPLLRLLHMQQQLQSTVPLLILNEGDSVAL